MEYKIDCEKINKFTKNLNIQILTRCAIRRKNIQSKIHVMISKKKKKMMI